MKSHGRIVAGLALCLGCASATTGREERQAEWAPPGASLFTSQELARYAQRGSVADLLEHASPAILGRGRSMLVSIDGAAPVDRAVLSTILASTISDVRLVHSARSASAPPAIQSDGRVVSVDILYVRTRK
jgi:hypothetical protein